MSLSVEKHFRPDEKTERELVGAYSRLCQAPSSDQDELVFAARELAIVLNPHHELFPSSPARAVAESLRIQSFFFSEYPTELLVSKLAQIDDLTTLNVLVSDPDTTCLFPRSVLTALVKRMPPHKIGFESFVSKHVTNIADNSFLRHPVVDPFMEAQLKRAVLKSKKHSAEFALSLYETIVFSSETCVLELLSNARDVVSLDTHTVQGPVINVLAEKFPLSFLKSITLFLFPNVVFRENQGESFVRNIIHRLVSPLCPHWFQGNEVDRAIMWLAQLRSDRRIVLDDITERAVFSYAIVNCKGEGYAMARHQPDPSIVARLFDALQISTAHGIHYMDLASHNNMETLLFIASKCRPDQLIRFHITIIDTIVGAITHHDLHGSPLLEQAKRDLVDKICHPLFREALLTTTPIVWKQIITGANDYAFDKVFPLIKESFIQDLIDKRCSFEIDRHASLKQRMRYDKIMFEVRMRSMFLSLATADESNVVRQNMSEQWLLDTRVFQVVGKFVCITGNPGGNRDNETKDDVLRMLEFSDDDDDEEEEDEDDDDDEDDEDEEGRQQNASPPPGYNAKRLRIA